MATTRRASGGRYSYRSRTQNIKTGLRARGLIHRLGWAGDRKRPAQPVNKPGEPIRRSVGATGTDHRKPIPTPRCTPAGCQNLQHYSGRLEALEPGSQNSHCPPQRPLLLPASPLSASASSPLASQLPPAANNARSRPKERVPAPITGSLPPRLLPARKQFAAAPPLA